MRKPVFAVCLLLSAGALRAQLTAPAPAQFAQPDQPAVSVPARPPAVPPISNWALDPENSSAGFVVKHVFSKVRGLFAQPRGTVVLDEAAPANTKISATINVNLLTTGVEERDAHLKSADFFDAAKFPTLTFVSTGVSRSGPESYSVTGNLTMHGVTRPVTLAVAVSAPFNHAGGIRRGIEATTSVNRKDFGLRWEFPGEGAGVVVGDIVQITINAELVLQPGPVISRIYPKID